MNNKLQGLPISWKLTTLGELGVVLSGGTPSTSQPQYWGEEIPWITPADLSNYSHKYISKGKRSITKIGLDYSSAVLLPTGALLFSTRAPIGYIAIAHNEISTNQGFKNLIPTSYTYVDYLYYYLQSAKQLILDKARGTTFLELSGAAFSQIPVPLAPFNEQYRIVSKIEELFSEINKAEESLDKAKNKIELQKHILLKEAFNGVLTKGWRASNLNPISKNEEYRDAIPNNWNWLKIQDVAEIIMGQSPPGESYNTDGIGMPLINGPAEFGPTPFSYTTLSKWTTEPTKLCSVNDLIICVRGSTTGRQNIAGFKACIGRGVASIRATRIQQKYLYHYFNYSRDEIFKLGTGSTFPNVSYEQIANLPIPVCSDDEQMQIINEIEYRNSVIDNLELSINKSLETSNFYRQKILKKAFEGRLVKQNPEDEDADTLLNKIRIAKQQYIEERELTSKSDTKVKRIEQNLEEILKTNFQNRVFTNEDLKSVVKMAYQDLKDQLFLLLQKQDSIEASFDEEKQRIVYKMML